MSLAHDMSVLERTPLLGDLGRDALRLLAFSAKAQEFRPGDVIFERNQRADGGIVIISGRAVLLLPDGSSDRQTGPGTLFGERALIVETKRPITVIAREPTRVLHISRELFHRMLTEYPALAAGLHSRFAEQLLNDSQAMETVRIRLENIAPPS